MKQIIGISIKSSFPLQEINVISRIIPHISLIPRRLAWNFSEMLANAIQKYQNRAIETAQVILEMIELAKKMNQAHFRGDNMGLTPDEMAFYDTFGRY